MHKSERPKHSFVWVRDEKNNEYLCPLSELKDARDATHEELEQCINATELEKRLE
jgi:hypothetical protein